MLERVVPITFLALLQGFAAPASPRTVVDPTVETIVVPDESDEDFLDLDAPEAPQPPDAPDAADQMVVRIGRQNRGYLGVQLIEMTPELREHFGVARDAGVMIGGVEKESPAAKAGVLVGDIVTAADGDRIENTGDLSHAVRGKKAGETVKLEVSRDRVKKQLAVTVADRPGREIRVGELPTRLRHRTFVLKDNDGQRSWMSPLGDMGRMQERLDDLEKRLKDLEKKLPSR